MKTIKALTLIAGSLFSIAFISAIASFYSENSLYETINDWAMIVGFIILVAMWLIAANRLFDDKY